MNSNGFSIRYAALEDAADIAFVKYDGWQKTYRGIIDDTYLNAMNLEKETERWAQIIQQPLGFNLVLVSGTGQIVGFISGGKSRDSKLNCDAEVYALYLLQKYHGMGLGQKLLLHTMLLFRESGYGSFCLFVLTQNPTLSFYQKFNPDKSEIHKIQIGGKEYEETLLVWNSLNSITQA